ncbi:hypothetical protein HHI36_016219 [Cryptolaemus montrouzieri]|uniref:Uncharacterized protein n=1 Tax=Cryptolaemus montrouzieri TaxID=559131 RepID=A0ABD2NJU4_9CUCU
MTSFEVSIRPQQNMFQRKQRDFMTNEPKIQEITETESTALEDNKDLGKRITDSSLHLQEPIKVQESCPSPEPSIRIDMKDYESSDEDSDDVASRIGATFYENLMDQVNKIIRNAQKQTNGGSRMSNTDELKNKTMNKVRDATVKHLRKIGIDFSTIEEVSNSHCSSDDSTSEQISFAVRQLLMKYLPDDQLAKFTPENNKNTAKRRNEDKIVLNSRAPEFSFATVQFMKKYNLIAADEIHQKSPIPTRTKPNRVLRRPNENNPKILDITALKQQPKLL